MGASASAWPAPGLFRRQSATVLERALERDPAHEALVCADARLTYEELDRAAERAAGALAAMGVKKDDVVAVSLPNASDVVITFHAVARLGAIWLGVNRNLAPPEKRFILGDADARLLLASPEVADGLGHASHRRSTPPTIVVGETGSWRDMVDSGQCQLPPAEPSSHGSGRDRLHQRHDRSAQGRRALPSGTCCFRGRCW